MPKPKPHWLWYEIAQLARRQAHGAHGGSTMLHGLILVAAIFFSACSSPCLRVDQEIRIKLDESGHPVMRTIWVNGVPRQVYTLDANGRRMSVKQPERCIKGATLKGFEPYRR